MSGEVGSLSPSRRHGPAWADLCDDPADLCATSDGDEEDKAVKKLSLFSALGVEDQPGNLRRGSVSSSTVTGDASASEVASSAGTNSPRNHEGSTDDLRSRGRGFKAAPNRATLQNQQAFADKKKKGSMMADRIAEASSPDASPRRRNRGKGQFADASPSKAVKNITLEQALSPGLADDRGRSRKQKQLDPRTAREAQIAASASPCRSQAMVNRQLAWGQQAQSSSPVRARMGPQCILGTDFNNAGSQRGGFFGTQPMQQDCSPTNRPVRPPMPWLREGGSPMTRGNQQRPLAGFDWAPVEDETVAAPNAGASPQMMSMLSTSPYSMANKHPAMQHSNMPPQAQMMMPHPMAGSAGQSPMARGYQPAPGPAVLTSTMPPAGPVSVSTAPPSMAVAPPAISAPPMGHPHMQPQPQQVLQNVMGADSMQSMENLTAQLLAAQPEVYED